MSQQLFHYPDSKDASLIREFLLGNKQERRDYLIHKTAHTRSKIYNFWRKITGNTGGVDGYLTVRVRRAKRDKEGNPLKDDNGNIIYEREYRTVEDNKHNLLTTNGRDWIHEQVLTNATAGAAEQGAQEVAVSTDSGGASAAHDALSGNSVNEINSGGLTRKNADTITHTDNTNATSLVTTFTSSTTHTNVQLAGLFYDPTSRTGQLIFENTFTATTLNNGDALELTWSITIG